MSTEEIKKVKKSKDSEPIKEHVVTAVTYADYLQLKRLKLYVTSKFGIEKRTHDQWEKEFKKLKLI